MGKDFHEFAISPDAAAIFRGTVALSGDAEGIALLIRGGLGFLDGDDVVPAVAEIVGICEPFDVRLYESVERKRRLLGREP
jgi:hypothetical protein